MTDDERLTHIAIKIKNDIIHQPDIAWMLDKIVDLQAEIVRHHKDFERWEAMADDACKRADFYKSKALEMADTVDHLLAVDCPGAERRAVALKRLAALRLAAP